MSKITENEKNRCIILNKKEIKNILQTQNIKDGRRTFNQFQITDKATMQKNLNDQMKKRNNIFQEMNPLLYITEQYIIAFTKRFHSSKNIFNNFQESP